MSFALRILLFAVIFQIISQGEDEHTSYLPITLDNIFLVIPIYTGPTLYEKSYTANDDIVIVQKEAKLMWVNEPNVGKGKCAKIHKDTFRSELETAKGFCSSKNFGDFAGFSNWRTPTASELKAFVKATKDMDVNYDAHCNKLLALKKQGLDTKKDSSYTTISTRFDDEHPLGTDLQSLVPNIGLRCVRTMDE